MQEELNKVLNYILNSHSVPEKALKRTKRLKIGMFGKMNNSEVLVDTDEIIIKTFNTPTSQNVSMTLYHGSNFERNQFAVTVNKTAEMEGLSLFAERTERLFEVMICDDFIRISTDELSFDL